MGAAATPEGPDFSLGIELGKVPSNGTIAGRVGDEPVLLSKLDGEWFAVAGSCTHYGAALAGGLVDGDNVRCPLHHACFSLRTGAALRAPAFAPLDRWHVEVEKDKLFVRTRLSAPVAASLQSSQADGIGSVLIVGGGAAGFACADELRGLGFAGRITMVTAEPDAPYDRPNLSKDFLAGTAPEAWIPLRDDDFYREAGIELKRGEEIVAINTPAGFAVGSSGERFPYDRLLLATGAEPVRLAGFEHNNVLSLRSLSDARTLIDRAQAGTRAAVLGSSFIGLEAASALRARGVGVDVISPESVPFERAFGREIGLFLQRLHESKGVRFHLERTASSFDGRQLALDDLSVLDVDFILAGVGVRPRTALATGRVAVDDGILVDSSLATSVPGIYAAGDVAAYPDPLSGRPLRIEHWVTAQRQGQVAARNMIGIATAFAAIPFFWTEQYGVALRYVGHARDWDQIRIDGDLDSLDFIARYVRGGHVVASLACGRDRESLEDERSLERRIETAGDRRRADQAKAAKASTAETFAPQCHRMAD